jgi:hypothetical protein
VASVKVPTGSGSCTVDLEASVARLVVELSAAVTPWLSLVRWVVSVDGSPWFGPFLKDRGPLSPEPNDALTVYSICEDGGRGYQGEGLAPGRHHVSVTAQILGGDALPALEADVSLACPAGPAPDPDDAGYPRDGGFGGTAVPPSDAAATPASVSSPKDSGCSATSGSLGSAGPLTGLALACAAFFATRRTRRTQRCRRTP